ncbi:ATP-grasp domain-containing protein [Kitasatospora sp. NPDC058965]|uniref:ATP-grasp domain-containing protein n=1 Tax=Kitasatospora sp. NPDC058965 TaxID=3346682 RepID=UPI0036CF8001
MQREPEERPVRLLVTGVGGAPGLDLALTLAERGHKVAGTDANPLAPGLLAPGITTRLVARADSPVDYEADLLQVCADLQIEAVVPTVEHELARLLSLKDTLAAAGVRTWLPTPAAVAASTDKWTFHQVLAAHQVPTPATVLPTEIDRLPAGVRLVVKPRRGQGAKDLYYCDSAEQARVLCQLAPDPIVQQRLDGFEFSADCLVDRAGRASVVLRRRLWVAGGLSMVATTFHDEEAAESVRQTLAAVGAVAVRRAGLHHRRQHRCPGRHDRDQRQVRRRVRAERSRRRRSGRAVPQRPARPARRT